MLNNLTGWHAVLILVVILLLFGAGKLPALAKSAGQSARILKSELREGATTPTPAPDAPSTATAESSAEPQPRVSSTPPPPSTA
ncbi:twin-arginine translocase TatA/TatE family subunit [Microbacterium aurantiacum]|uniref:Sec-independent protein translocase protein TatA n=1 Tax=Microbacterium aurantiacum TaxID=162393 RepID=A0ABT8FNK0_9MICO|nr:twin-arginine translocase TatA/TatE family subunit [Microbacterium aurantiacum]MDN4462894.1 twin-arginine translocase TatA/TatE family subunit [Microbacterium aurantiacum]